MKLTPVRVQESEADFWLGYLVHVPHVHYWWDVELVKRVGLWEWEERENDMQTKQASVHTIYSRASYKTHSA